MQPALRDVSAAGIAPSVRGHGLVARGARRKRDSWRRLATEVAARDGRAAAVCAARRRDSPLSRGERQHEWPAVDRRDRREAAGVAAETAAYLHRLNQYERLYATSYRR